MKFKKNRLSLDYFLFVLSTTILMLFFIIADFSSYPIHSFKDIAHVGSQCFLIGVISFSFLYIAGLNKYVFAILYPILIFICSVLGYFAWTMNTTLTVMILDATLHNDMKTSSDLISVSLIITVSISLLLALFITVYRFSKVKIRIKGQVLFLILSVLVLLSFTNITKTRQIAANHIPFNIYYVSSNYYKGLKTISAERHSLAKNSICDADSLTVVFVIGESLRADHLQINGYERNTTPLLAKTKNLISLPNLYTKYTYTNKSLPFILTRADSLTEDIAYTERSFIDIFNYCGWKTSWLANQEPGNTYTYFMHECDTLIFATLNKSPYTFDKWLDESLLPHYKERLGNDTSKQLIILHTIGSHWWYNSHFTDEFEKFRPVIKSKIVTSNTKEEIINSYDNTILYTDNFLSNLIGQLENKNAVLIYLSDHGESLGENNVWLHAADSPPIHYPAGLVWLSDIFIKRYPEKYEALKLNVEKKQSESFLFHSILDAASISSPVLDRKLSIFFNSIHAEDCPPE